MNLLSTLPHQRRLRSFSSTCNLLKGIGIHNCTYRWHCHFKSLYGITSEPFRVCLRVIQGAGLTVNVNSCYLECRTRITWWGDEKQHVFGIKWILHTDGRFQTKRKIWEFNRFSGPCFIFQVLPLNEKWIMLSELVEANRTLANWILISQKYRFLVSLTTCLSPGPLRSRYQGEIKHGEEILLERK